ncbi:MAG: UbiX family flavin prenyltransferase [Thermodesulfobacteriota bacterium]
MEIIVAITGASGAPYGVRLVKALLERGDEVYLIISPPGAIVFKHETGISINGGGEEDGATLRRFIGVESGTLHSIGYNDLLSSLASGSTLKRLMIVCPASMGSIARIAGGISGNLIERAADCVIKEQGRLILVPREMPLSPIHLENMLKLSRIGVSIVPAMPAFYTKPETVEDMVNFVVGKVLDAAGIENNLYNRWSGEPPR